MEVKIQIPDNCELIKDGDTYIVKEKKKDNKPRTWKEFCENYPIKSGESYIVTSNDRIFTIDESYDGKRLSKNWCISKQEAAAFLALMQLRQLRKAWVGDWEHDKIGTVSVIKYRIDKEMLEVDSGCFCHTNVLSFPTQLMAYDFLGCFKDLCETAKILL